MSELNEPAPRSRRNPLIWIVLIVIGLILFVFISGERGDMPGKLAITTLPDSAADTRAAESSVYENVDAGSSADETDEPPVSTGLETDSGTGTDIYTSSIREGDAPLEASVGVIQRSLLVPPGMRARQYIEKLRGQGKPYPLSQVFDRAGRFRVEGSLADAHLLYFFAARENHLPAIMMMGEMSDPLLFRAEDSLLDEADVIQAYKWYRKAADLGQPKALQRLDELGRWAAEAAVGGNSDARQLLLNMQ